MTNFDITFVLPGDYRSGGVRVTVLMANRLMARGHRVRIACPRRRWLSVGGLRRLVRRAATRGSRNAGWLHQFEGKVESYGHLDDLGYAENEIVIAVGTYMVADVRAMTKPVVKVRYHHGFPARPDAIQEAAWHGRMPTITVSGTLVPRLQAQTEGSVWGVVPNGIDLEQYFPDPGDGRDGVGALFNPHPNKSIEDMFEVLRRCQAKWPGLPQRVFGTDACPAELAHADYTRLPSVDVARRIYSRSKVWLLTSKTEGLPGVVLEAMACGCVVVSSDNDGSLEVLRDGENGLVVPHGDINGYLAAVERVISDDGLREKLSVGARSTVSQFTWDRAADRMEAFLNHVHPEGGKPVAGSATS